MKTNTHSKPRHMIHKMFVILWLSTSQTMTDQNWKSTIFVFFFFFLGSDAAFSIMWTFQKWLYNIIYLFQNRYKTNRIQNILEIYDIFTKYYFHQEIYQEKIRNNSWDSRCHVRVWSRWKFPYYFWWWIPSPK